MGKSIWTKWDWFRRIQLCASFIVDYTYLYFSSNMPGGCGVMNLYRININDDISNAQNLKKINSKKNEIFPFID